MATIRKKSQAQEKRVAKETQGKTTVASGAKYFQKGDVRNTKFLIECKTTANDYYILTQKVWNKISKEALADGLRTPIMQIDLNNGNTHLAVMNYLDFVGYDFDKKMNWIGNEAPLLSAKMSYKVTGDFTDINYPEDIKDKVYRPLNQFKLVDYNLHLVVLLWEDFLELSATLCED